MSPVLELPTELIIEILSSCSSTDLKRLCEACRTLYDIVMPELYRTIDLSSHTARIESELIGLGPHWVPPDFTLRRWNCLDLDVLERQLEFIRTIGNNPALAKYAHELRWTVMSFFKCEEGAWEDEVSEDGIERVRAEHYDSVLNTENAEDYGSLWRIFLGFANVSKIDIWLEAGDHLLLSSPCFPKATSIRLSGCMTRNPVERFLGSSAKRLQRLELHNLLQCEEYEPPFPEFTDPHTLETYLQEHGSDHRTFHQTQRMVNALNPFVGKFAALTPLCIATVGEAQLDLPYDERDDRQFAEWARLISSVRPNLRLGRTVPTAAYDTRVRRRQPYVGRPLIGWPVAVGGEGLGVVVRLYGPELSDLGLSHA